MTIAYADVQDEIYWLYRTKLLSWRKEFGTDALWETKDGQPYPRRFPFQAVHFEIASLKGLSILVQLNKFRMMDRTRCKSWEVAFAHHLLTEKTYGEQTDVEERAVLDQTSTPKITKERAAVVAGYLAPTLPDRWPEYALQGRSKDDLWALRAKETASLTRAAQRVSNGRIDRVA